MPFIRALIFCYWLRSQIKGIIETTLFSRLGMCIVNDLIFISSQFSQNSAPTTEMLYAEHFRRIDYGPKNGSYDKGTDYLIYTYTV